MPNRRTVYDKGDPKAEPPVPHRVHEMWDVDAKEAVANGKGRYSMTKPPGFGAPPPPPARAAAPPARGRVKPKPAPEPEPESKPVEDDGDGEDEAEPTE